MDSLVYYNSIDTMPIYNWFKLSESNDLGYLLIDYKKELSEKEIIELRAAHLLLEKDFIDTFGISDNYKRYLELKKDIALLELEVVITGDKSLENFVDKKKIDLQEFNVKTNTTNYDVKSQIEKYMGFRIDLKSTTIKEYYHYIKLLETENKSNVR